MARPPSSTAAENKDGGKQRKIQKEKSQQNGRPPSSNSLKSGANTSNIEGVTATVEADVNKNNKGAHRRQKMTNNHDTPGRGGRGGRPRGEGRGRAQSSSKSSSGDGRQRKTNVEDKKEQDILIAFMPLLRHDKDQEAVEIYEAFQTTGNQATFLEQAQQLILSKQLQQQQPQGKIMDTPPAAATGATPVEEKSITTKVDSIASSGQSLVEKTSAVGDNMKISAEDGLNGSSDTVDQKDAVEEIKPATVQHTSSYLPKRTMRNQPGTIVIHGATTNRQQQGLVRPRQEIEARWSIPLSNIRLLLSDALKKQDTDNVLETKDNAEVKLLQDDIRSTLQLSIGLFRLGTESNYNSHSKQNTSIISKEIESFQIHDDMVMGKVPFYAPRTPGNVVFRMYMESNPIPTLATSSPICVQLLDPDLDPTLRFVLSGIKSRKGSALGSLYTVASVLSSWVTSSSNSTNTITTNSNYYEAAGRTLWGCICECRKLVEASKEEYFNKIDKLVEKMDALSLEQAAVQEGDKDQDEKEEAPQLDVTIASGAEDHDGDSHEIKSESKQAILKKLVSMKKEKAHLEKNWRDLQAAFASIINIVISNEQTMCSLLRQDPIHKLRMEYTLWCPICESSAPAPAKGASSNLSSYVQMKHEMQRSILGFIPDETKIVLSNDMSSSATTCTLAVLHALTTSMHRLYEVELSPSSDFYLSREKVRLDMERFVNSQCSTFFPVGTRVMVFGSSANGFGSPTSDLDMCLQLPASNSDFSSDDWFATKGRDAMGALAETLKIHDMKEVDSTRLTARIPVIMFRYPLRSATKGVEEEVLLDCDISMRNPLAVLNTQFLRIYSMLDPRVQVLASVIKRWAKARRINDPKTHTLSSYGYLIMLLHFLLLRRKRGMCLPNLLYTDPNWTADNVYSELANRPVIDSLMFRHPNEEAYIVNAYFYQPRDEATLHSLRRVVSGGQAANNSTVNISCTVGVLLAEFFRYYAYEFDYKHHVISLHSGGPSRGFVEKEMKGESDGWKIGGDTLGIEDPFERFYNIAHVVTGTQLRRIRKEFALAYTKISERCRKANDNTSKSTEDAADLLTILCEVDEGEK